MNASLRPDFTSKLVHRLAFGTPKFYIAPYDKINHRLVNLSCNCDVKSGLNWSSTLSSKIVELLQGGESRDLFRLFRTCIRTERVRKLFSTS